MQSFNYQKNIEKQCFWEIQNIDNSEDFEKLLSNIKPGHCLYRGVTDRYYKLYSSFQRNLFSTKFADVKGIHEKIFDETLLKPTVTKIDYPVTYPSNMRVKLDLVIRVNSFIQHYYGITPYLDVSEDFDIALFFAFRDVKEGLGMGKYVSVASIPKTELSKADIFLHKLERSFLNYNTANNSNLLTLDSIARASLSDLNSHILEKVFNDTDEEYVWIERNEINGNERIKAQNGSFLLFRPRLEIKDNLPFEEIYFKAHHKKLTCYHISIKLREYVKQYLNGLGINEYSLKLAD